METEILEGQALGAFVDKLGADMVGLSLEGRFYRNVQNKQNVAIITARMGEFIGIGFSAKAAVDPDLGDDATVLLAVGRAFTNLGEQITQHIFENIELTLAHQRAVEQMQEAVAQMQAEGECTDCDVPVAVTTVPPENTG
jgi:hypothetical protein